MGIDDSWTIILASCSFAYFPLQSDKPERIVENISLFEFEMTKDELEVSLAMFSLNWPMSTITSILKIVSEQSLDRMPLG